MSCTIKVRVWVLCDRAKLILERGEDVVLVVVDRFRRSRRSPVGGNPISKIYAIIIERSACASGHENTIYYVYGQSNPSQSRNPLLV